MCWLGQLVESGWTLGPAACKAAHASQLLPLALPDCELVVCPIQGLPIHGLFRLIVEIRGQCIGGLHKTCLDMVPQHAQFAGIPLPSQGLVLETLQVGLCSRCCALLFPCCLIGLDLESLQEPMVVQLVQQCMLSLSSPQRFWVRPMQ